MITGPSNREAGISRAQKRIPSIISRHSPFSKLEAQAFIRPIRDYLSMVEGNSHSPKLADMLAVEREAFLEVGVESDLNDMRTCRRKALERPLAKEADPFWEEFKSDYTDFLLNLAHLHSRAASFNEACDILLRVRAVEKDNWHALKELAILYTIEEKPSLALQYFAEAKAVLAESRTKYEIPEADVIETAGFEARALAMSGEKIPLDKLAGMSGDKGALADFARYMIGVLLRKDEAGAKKLAADLKRGRHLARGDSRAIEKDLQTRIEGFREDERTEKALGFIDSITGSNVNLAREYKTIGKEICDALRGAGEENRTIIEDEALGLIADAVKDEKRVLGAILLSDQLVQADRDFGLKIKEFYRAVLAERRTREFIRDILFGIRKQSQLLAAEVAKGTHAPYQYLMSERTPQNEEFKRREALYDFFLKRLGDIEEVRGILASIDLPYAEPCSLASVWFLEKAATAKDPQQQLKLLRMAVAEDRSNIIAQIELASRLSAMGKRQESQKVVQEILDRTRSPAAAVVACEITAGNIIAISADKLKTGKSLAKECAEMQETHSRAMDACERLSGTEKELPAVKSALENIRLNAARVHEMACEFDKAAAFYNAVLAEDPLQEAAVRERSGILFLQGRFSEAISFFLEKIRLDAKLNPDPAKRDPYLFCFLAEALFQIAEERAYKDALDSVDAAIKLKNYLDFKLVKARLLAVLGKSQKAEAVLAEVKRYLEEKRPGLDAFRVTVAEGMYAIAMTDLRMAEEDWSGALGHARQAAELFSRSHSTKFQELDARWYALNLLAKMARDANDGKALAAAVREGEGLLRKHPYYPAFRQALVGPLMLLSRENEVLAHIRWLIDNLNGMSLDVFANLLIILYEKNDMAVTKEFLGKLRERMDERSFADLCQMGFGMVKSAYPQVEKMVQEAFEQG